MQNDTQVYIKTEPVSDPVGNGRTTVDFTPFTLTAAGDISWTVTIDDGDGAPDEGDEDTAVTRVVGGGS